MVEEQKREQKQSEFDPYECMICFELCEQAIECNSCHKMFCKQHEKNFNNRCPACRALPFEFKENIPIQKIIVSLKKKQPITCKVKDCGFIGTRDEFKAHASDKHQQLIVDSCQNKNEIENLQKIVEKNEQQKNILRHVLRRATNQSQEDLKKIPTDEQKKRMYLHSQNCQNQGCKSVYNGKWGTFIGGENGRTHFDLTNCVTGKLLNEEIGWDYNNPRC